jgi:hypothetical protein
LGGSGGCPNHGQPSLCILASSLFVPPGSAPGPPSAGNPRGITAKARRCEVRVHQRRRSGLQGSGRRHFLQVLRGRRGDSPPLGSSYLWIGGGERPLDGRGGGR